MPSGPKALFRGLARFTPRDSKHELVGRLWQFRGATNVDITANVYRTDTGFELCIDRDNEMFSAGCYSSTEDAEARAEQLAATLREIGFIEQRGDEHTGPGEQT